MCHLSFNKKTVLAEQYGKWSQRRVSFILKSANVLGNPTQFKALDDYSATASSSPPLPLYTSWAAFSAAGTVPTGFTVRTSYSLKVLFYSPKIISTLLLKKKEEEERKTDPTALAKYKIINKK